MTDESTDLDTLTPQQQVWAYEPLGGFWKPTVLSGTSGRVEHVRDDGRVVVEWDNGKKTTAQRFQLCTEVLDEANPEQGPRPGV